MMKLEAKQRLQAATKFTDFDQWQAACRAKAAEVDPSYAKKIKFTGHAQGKDDAIHALVREADRSFGMWEGDETGHGVVYDHAD